MHGERNINQYQGNNLCRDPHTTTPNGCLFRMKGSGIKIITKHMYECNKLSTKALSMISLYI